MEGEPRTVAEDEEVAADIVITKGNSDARAHAHAVRAVDRVDADQSVGIARRDVVMMMKKASTLGAGLPTPPHGATEGLHLAAQAATAPQGDLRSSAPAGSGDPRRTGPVYVIGGVKP